MKHLWEVKHPYTCTTDDSSNLYYECLDDFLSEMSNADFDYNLLFRWDWKEDGFDGDVNCPNGVLYCFWMQQRLGKHISTTVPVCRADEDRVKEFIKPRWAYLKQLWEPFE